MNLKEHIKGKIFRAVSQAAKELDQPAYVIGGFVRDIFLDRPSKDVDIVTVGSGIELARKTADILKVKNVAVFKNFGTAQIKTNEWEIEFVGARKESYNRNSRKPVVEEGTLEDDQNRRDFTINALAISLNEDSFGQLIDPFKGLNDLNNGVIRTPLDPNITYSDDPLRMLRAIRFATQLGFKIEGTSFNSIKENAHRLKIISQERITDELNKIIMSNKPSVGFLMLDKTGLLELFFPEMTDLKGTEMKKGVGHKDNFLHTIQVLDRICPYTDNLWLRWSAILHDIAKPPTKKFEVGKGWTFHGHEDLGARMVPKIFKNLKLPLDKKMKYVQKLVRLHLRPIALSNENITDSAIRRLIFDAGEDLEDLLTLCEADITTKNKEKERKYLNNFKLVRKKIEEVTERDNLRNWQPPISGELIMKTFNISPCKEVGIIKNSIREAILDGIIKNDFEESYNFMLNIGEDLGLNNTKTNSKLK